MNAQVGAAVLLSAGWGTRLLPLTTLLPKCLMPVGPRPLLDYWINNVQELDVDRIVINAFAHWEQIERYGNRNALPHRVEIVREPALLGTAGTLRALAPQLPATTVLVAHADNLCLADLAAFLRAHQYRPQQCVITMMTFTTTNPQACGIVEIENSGVVTKMTEKPAVPIGNLANGAVYLVEPEVLDFICANPSVSDFSTHVLPSFMERIYSWHNSAIHRDIGTIEQLRFAQNDHLPEIRWGDDEWLQSYLVSDEVQTIRDALL